MINGGYINEVSICIASEATDWIFDEELGEFTFNFSINRLAELLCEITERKDVDYVSEMGNGIYNEVQYVNQYILYENNRGTYDELCHKYHKDPVNDPYGYKNH